MKAEYIPGDLVYFGGEKAMVEFQNPSAEDSVWVRVIEDGGENRSWNASLKEEIDGIPLTTKILEKNGLRLRVHHERKNYDYTEYYNPALFSIQLRYYSEDKIFYPFCYNNEIEVKGGNEIKYVHQLQHLLFGLGLDSRLEV